MLGKCRVRPETMTGRNGQDLCTRSRGPAYPTCTGFKWGGAVDDTRTWNKQSFIRALNIISKEYIDALP